MNNGLTTLDDQLRELALTDWQAFVSLIGAENINRAKVCLMRKKNKSMRTIANKLNITKKTVEVACGKCPI